MPIPSRAVSAFAERWANRAPLVIVPTTYYATPTQHFREAGISTIIQPGGSVRDDEVIAAAKAAGVTMFFTGERHFFH